VRAGSSTPRLCGSSATSIHSTNSRKTSGPVLLTRRLSPRALRPLHVHVGKGGDQGPLQALVALERLGGEALEKEQSMGIAGVHHLSFSVTNLERTVDFYRNVIGLELRSRTHNEYDELGWALFGREWGRDQGHAELEIAVMQLGVQRVEFIEYKDPMTAPYHRDPSIAGSAHLAIRVTDIESERERLEKAGVVFHSPINIFNETGKPPWKWCYFRDPDGICLELVESED